MQINGNALMFFVEISGEEKSNNQNVYFSWLGRMKKNSCGLVLVFLLLVFVQLASSITQTFSFTKDAYVIKGNNGKYGTANALNLYTPNALYLEMDITSISTKCPTSAFIKMYSTAYGPFITGKTVKATRIAANWDEGTVDGNFNPTKSESITGSFVSIGSSFYTFDLSNTMLIKAIGTQSSQVWFSILFWFFLNQK